LLMKAHLKVVRFHFAYNRYTLNFARFLRRAGCLYRYPGLQETNVDFLITHCVARYTQ
jgi:hypothetical protein